MARPAPQIRIGPAEDAFPIAVGSAPTQDVQVPETCAAIYNAGTAVVNLAVTMRSGEDRVFPFYPGYNPVIVDVVKVTGSTFGASPNIWAMLAGWRPGD